MFSVLKFASLKPQFIIIYVCYIIHIDPASSSISNTNPLESANPFPYALSPTYLTFLAKQERTIYKAMKDYTKELEKRLKLLNRYTIDYEESSLKAINHVTAGDEDGMQEDEVVASNPILAFRMLSRYANEFTEVGQHIGESAEEVSSDIVLRAKGVYDFPSHLDSRDALQGILRMQFMYDLDALSIAEGRLPGVDSPIGLTTNQCYNFAKAAQMIKFFTLALDWFNVTKSKYNTDLHKSAYSWDERRLESDVDLTISRHDREFALNFEEKYEYSFTDQLQSSEASRPETLRSKLLEEFRGVHLNEDDPDYFQAIYINHVDICNGANFQAAKEKSRLKCWHDKRRNPYFAINPLKIELLNSNPRIIQIHDVLSPQWIKYLKTKAGARLERAPGGANATPRTAAYAWFEDKEIPEVPISRRIELITGLNVVGENASEALQIAAYAFGGHVELHYDSKGPDDPEPNSKGDRVTTFLAYLNDVKHGGRTSFPKLGFGVDPIKGSAILWYTNLKNGAIDPATLHAACPLLSGQKWIATKWTHINENILKRPCDRNLSI